MKNNALAFIVFICLGMLVCLGGCGQQYDSPNPLSGSPLIDAPAYFGTYKVPEDNQTTEAGVELGRMLFYEKMLSADNTLSCASCHKQEHAFSDERTFSIGVDGKPGKRQSMSLANLVWQTQFFWDGRVSTLEKQALFPIQDSLEMHQPLDKMVGKLQASANYPVKFMNAFGTDQITAELVAKALAQFERTLVSSNSRYDKFIRKEYVLSAQERNGMVLFQTHPTPENGLRGGNCGDCHGGGYLTFLNGFHNNGLDASPSDPGLGGFTKAAFDNGKFKVPTLRNIAMTAPYMHDGRFNSLEEVLDHYNEHVQNSATLDPNMSASNKVNGKSLGLTAQEKADIIAFLKTLSDSTFIQNPKFASPF